MLFQYIFPIEIDTFVPICNVTILEIIIKNKTKKHIDNFISKTSLHYLNAHFFDS